MDGYEPQDHGVTATPPLCGPSGGAVASPSPAKPAAANASDDPYWDYDDEDCWNCGGEGYVHGCSWDWQCDTYDAGEGTCLCTRACHICHPPKPNPAMERRDALDDADDDDLEAWLGNR